MKKLDRAFIPNNRTFALFVIMLALLGCASYLAVQRTHAMFAQFDDEQSIIEQRQVGRREVRALATVVEGQ